MTKEITLRDLQKLTKYTERRIQKAKRVLQDPSDKNLRAYNHVEEIHDKIIKKTGIYPSLTKEEKIASEIWLARCDKIEWY